ncbi:hypothetical protein L0222_20705 [bacterium]|nr:hypothetical protein [bacterium]MCI0603752.1 hypothetical protein [bacterium]
MPKILSVAILFAMLIALSQFARTTTGGYRVEEQNASAIQAQNRFSLKKSYQLGNGDRSLLATIYSCGLGAKKKEILSIWSRGSDAYELQYIKAAANGQSFMEPFFFSVENSNFIRISTRNQNAAHVVTDSVLSLKPDSTLAEIELKEFKEIMKMNLRDVQKSM